MSAHANSRSGVRKVRNYILKTPEIGGGTYGKVYCCTRDDVDRQKYDPSRKEKKLVVKEMDLRKANKKTVLSSEQEAGLLKKLKHPNIVQYVDSFDQNGYLYIVMGLCEGGDLYKRVKQQKLHHPVKYFDEHQTMLWFIQIAMALNYLHTENILHRDLKTQNIFLTAAGIVKVGDLGIAKVLEDASDDTRTVVGTPYYMSPELFQNKPYGVKSDVWSMGCVLYELCTLRHAFVANDLNSLSNKVCRGRKPAMPTHYSRELCDLLDSMLVHNPQKRPRVKDILRNQFVKQHILRYLNRKENGSQQPSSSSSSSVTRSNHSPARRTPSPPPRVMCSPAPAPIQKQAMVVGPRFNEAAREARRQRILSGQHRRVPGLVAPEVVRNIEELQLNNNAGNQRVSSARAEEAYNKISRKQDKVIDAMKATMTLLDNDDDDDDKKPQDGAGKSDEEEEVKESVFQVAVGSRTLNSKCRLDSRIIQLHTVCMRGLGYEKFTRAFKIIETMMEHDEDEDSMEYELKKFMTDEEFDEYAPKMWNLKFCEDVQLGKR